jgi:MFS family permease
VSGTRTTQQRAVLLVASLAVGLAFLDETAVVTALRAIQADLGMSSLELQWVMGAYLLALASLMVAAGRLADVHGRRRTFLVGAVGLPADEACGGADPTRGASVPARRRGEASRTR